MLSVEWLEEQGAVWLLLDDDGLDELISHLTALKRDSGGHTHLNRGLGLSEKAYFGPAFGQLLIEVCSNEQSPEVNIDERIDGVVVSPWPEPPANFPNKGAT